MRKFLEVCALALALTVIVWLVDSENLDWVPLLLIVIILFAIVVTRWPYGAFVALVCTSAMPHFFLEIFGWKARPEHIVLGIIVSVALVRILLGKSTVRLAGLDYLVVTYLGVMYVSSIFMSVRPSSTIKWALLYNFAMLPYFLFRFFATDLRIAQKLFNLVLAVGAAEAAYGIICMISYGVFGTTFGVEPGQYGYIPGIYGTQFEANLFGSYTASAAAMFFALFLIGEQRMRRWMGIGFLITATGTLASLSRGAMLSLLVACAFVIWIGGSNKASVRKRLILSVTVSTVLLVIAIPLAGNFLAERFATLDASDPFSDQTSSVRLMQVASAVPDILRHPILGNGADSFQLNFDWSNFVQEWDIPGYLPSTLLRVLYDTGLVGLTIFLAIVIWAGKKLWIGIRDKGDKNPMLIALLAGCLVYAIAFIGSDASILAYSWVQLGLAVTTAMLVERSEFLNKGSLEVRPAS